MHASIDCAAIPIAATACGCCCGAESHVLSRELGFPGAASFLLSELIPSSLLLPVCNTHAQRLSGGGRPAGPAVWRCRGCSSAPAHPLGCCAPHSAARAYTRGRTALPPPPPPCSRPGVRAMAAAVAAAAAAAAGAGARGGRQCTVRWAGDGVTCAERVPARGV
jgi:hypothetical protein